MRKCGGGPPPTGHKAGAGSPKDTCDARHLEMKVAQPGAHESVIFRSTFRSLVHDGLGDSARQVSLGMRGDCGPKYFTMKEGERLRPLASD